MIQDLLNHTIVITGASMGIGAATALECTARGANVALLARSSDKIEGLAAQIGSKAMALPLNVADAAAFFQAIDTVTERFGPIDALINNAGVIEPIAHLVDADPTVWSQAIDINLKGVFYGMRAVIPQMRVRGKVELATKFFETFSVVSNTLNQKFGTMRSTFTGVELVHFVIECSWVKAVNRYKLNIKLLPIHALNFIYFLKKFIVV